MARYVKRLSRQVGLHPGELVHIGTRKLDKVSISFIDYTADQYIEKAVKRIDECIHAKEPSTVSWINITGLHDLEVIEKTGKLFDLHPLSLEDILNTGQRPKFEDYESYIVIILKMLSYDRKSRSVRTEQASIILNPNYVITFQEMESETFNIIRNSIRSARGRIRKMGNDFLAYALIDAIIDSYYVILEAFGEQIEALEDAIIAHPESSSLNELHELKRELITIRKSVWPLRELINGLIRTESPLIQPSTQVYLKDAYDHVIQIIDSIETFRDIVASMVDIYLSNISYKMTEVMKVLTMIGTIFIPLTFIVGLYGMNFNTSASPWNMPELNWKYGYIGVWAIMIAVVTVMLVFFKRKKWI